MKIQVELNLEAAVAAAIAPEKLAPILDKHLTEAITSAIRDATGWDSEFRKGLQEQLRGMLPHGLRLDDVAKFQHVLNDALTSLVGSMNAEAVKTALKKAAADALPEVPSVVKLSELLEEARGGFHKGKEEAFYALWEPAEHGGGGHLYLHDETGSSALFHSRTMSKYDAKVQLAVTREGEVYALRLRDKQVTPASRPDVISGFDAILMSMYVGRTRLDVDLDEDDVSRAAEPHDD
ncbi:hypothetical protein [Pseudacidovorax sp. RU35E]|uniref:hypothetical protein n=1 Tax=Pseudacidovorax sp. RU35E TaxID=1907403 RepID=UPI000955B13A|nr:hypothetical protein [Pseudacidovorax sp. RU35E]SIR05582.1 hypothetical protein SAMN05880557_107266 [Pseudacidovorax sp. RU35E]